MKRLLFGEEDYLKGGRIRREFEKDRWSYVLGLVCIFGELGVLKVYHLLKAREPERFLGLEVVGFEADSLSRFLRFT